MSELGKRSFAGQQLDVAWEGQTVSRSCCYWLEVSRSFHLPVCLTWDYAPWPVNHKMDIGLVNEIFK